MATQNDISEEITREMRETRIFSRISENEDYQELDLSANNETETLVVEEFHSNMSTMIIFGQALDSVYQVEELLLNLHADLDLEQDLTFEQKSVMAFKLAEVHALVDSALTQVLPKTEDMPFHLPRSIY